MTPVRFGELLPRTRGLVATATFTVVYALPQTRPDGQPTLKADAAWGIVLDAAQPEVERIVAAWQLFALAPTHDTAHRLAALLREPTLWLGSEIVEIVRAIGADLALGVDGSGLLVLSPTPLSEVVQDSEGWMCPDVGRVVPIDQARALRPRLADELPWLVDPWNDPFDRVLAIAIRGTELDVVRGEGGFLPGPIKVRHPDEDRLREFPWGCVQLPPGEAVSIVRNRTPPTVELGRVVHLGGGVAGVLVYKPMQAWVIDDDIRAERIRRGAQQAQTSNEGVQFDGWAVARIRDGVAVRAWHTMWSNR